MMREGNEGHNKESFISRSLERMSFSFFFLDNEKCLSSEFVMVQLARGLIWNLLNFISICIRRSI